MGDIGQAASLVHLIVGTINNMVSAYSRLRLSEKANQMPYIHSTKVSAR
jgi:hypothetical protein